MQWWRSAPGGGVTLRLDNSRGFLEKAGLGLGSCAPSSLPSRGHLARSGDIFVCHDLEWGVGDLAGISWMETGMLLYIFSAQTTHNKE